MVKDDNLRQVVDAGYRRMATSGVCVCGLARDCAPALLRNLPLVDSLCARFGRADVVIVENDSKDGSKKILRAWAAERPHIKLLIDDFGTRTLPHSRSISSNPSFSRVRIEQLASHRNRYLDYTATLSELDYVVVVDLDLYRIEIDGIAHAFGQPIPWDAQFANGRISDACRPQLRDFYWDTYALWEIGDSTPQTEDKMSAYFATMKPLAKGMPLFAVQSAFGGLGVYRWAALKNARYGVEENIGDARVEVIGEHTFLHRRMIEAGHARLFINPSMLVHYNKPRSALALRAERLTHVVRRDGLAGAARKLARKIARTVRR